MSNLRRYAPLPRQSAKVKAQAPDFKAVYKEVDERSGGRCEVVIYTQTRSPMTVELPSWSGYRRPDTEILRCRHRATDPHHLYKPRRSHHDPLLIVHLCRHHHERCEWPYKKGRLAIALVNGAHRFRIVYASDKFAARGQA